jgi:hypothetical protein
VPIWLEVAKSIHQERLKEAERDRLGQEIVGVRNRRNSRKQPVLSQLRRWLGVRVPHTEVVQDQALNDGAAGHRPDDGARKPSERAPARYVSQ